MRMNNKLINKELIMDNELYNFVEETVDRLARETAIYYATGTCMWCGGHNKEV